MSRPAPKCGSTPEPGPPPRPRILIVDDESAVRAMLKTLLTEANFDTREARDGIEAIELLNSLAADVVLLDLKMPRLGGMAALHRIRQRWPVTKVIVFSGEGTSADETPLDKALVAGADFLLEKPVSRDGLLTALQLVLSQA